MCRVGASRSGHCGHWEAMLKRTGLFVELDVARAQLRDFACVFECLKRVESMWASKRE